MGGVINNTNVKRNATLTITITNPKPTTDEVNNDMDNKVDINTLNISSISSALDAAIIDIDAGSTASECNNNINNEIDASVLSALNAVIKDINSKPTTSRANNNTNAEVDADMIMR